MNYLVLLHMGIYYPCNVIVSSCQTINKLHFLLVPQCLYIVICNQKKSHDFGNDLVVELQLFILS
jgi:hypothetical protein